MGEVSSDEVSVESLGEVSSVLAVLEWVGPLGEVSSVLAVLEWVGPLGGVSLGWEVSSLLAAGVEKGLVDDARRACRGRTWGRGGRTRARGVTQARGGV